MNLRVRLLLGTAVLLSLPAVLQSPLGAQDDPVVKEIKEYSTKLADAFNSGNVDNMVNLFIEKGELIDEQGVVYQGREEIKQLLTTFMSKFPGAKLGEEVESIRSIGPLAIKEGIRVITTGEGDDATTSRVRFVTTYVRTDAGWQIACVRDFAEEAALAPGEQLQPLHWMIGDWVNEGADARVKITYRLSEDKNYILGDFDITDTDGVKHTSTQRIGWDPLLGKPRSWMFDSDGGFAEGIWTQTDDGWLVSSMAVMPDGVSGSASLKVAPGEKGSFTIAGTNRVVGNEVEEDFEITIVKQPPAAGK